MSSGKYKVGDCVSIKGDNGKDTIGKIEEIISDSGDAIIRYNLFYSPEDTQSGRQPHNSKNEVYKSDVTEKEFYANITQLVEVLTLEQYLKRRQSSSAQAVYFYRQKYLYQDDVFIPDLDLTCYCEKILNPDEAYAQCSKCKEYYHIDCHLKSESKKCFNELCNNIIEPQLPLSLQTPLPILTEVKAPIELGKKRNREEANDDLSIQKDKTEKTSANPSSDALNEKYSNLPEENRLNLMKEISQIEKKHLMLSKTLTEKDKVRQNAKDTILFSLLYGIEELRTFKDWTKFKKATGELSKENINDLPKTVHYCELLSMQIEDLIYFTNNSEVSYNYKKKLRTLYTHLDHERNTELRLSLLSNEITPKRLIGMSSDELAPKSFIQSRLEQQNKYFKEQVLIEEEAKIITKTHKGEEMLSAGNDSKAAGFVPFEVRKSNDVERKEEEENEDISEKASWDLGSDQEPVEKKAKKVQLKPIKRQEVRNEVHEVQQVPNLIKMKYKNLPSDKLKFYFFLEEFKKENIENKMNEKIKSTLKKETIEELNKMKEVIKARIKL